MLADQTSICLNTPHPLTNTTVYYSVHCSILCHYFSKGGMKIMEGETVFEFLIIISVSTLTKCFFMDLKYGAVSIVVILD